MRKERGISLKSKYIRLLTILLVLSLFAALSGTAYAADFSDSGNVGQPYKEAVTEMARRGVLNGFPDGAFHPDETLTREQGAKIITYIVLGDGVNALTCEKAPFDDVAANRWSAPCIAWCVEREILLGYGDGRYGPDDKLTGDQFAKMLLCALGLARDGNYVGIDSTWYIAVREDGKTAKLYEGDAGMMTAQPITRAQAALLAWNAVKAAETANQPATPTMPTNPTTPTTPVPITPQPGNDVETPEIDIDPSPTNPEPSVEEQPGTNIDDNGDILLPEVP